MKKILMSVVMLLLILVSCTKNNDKGKRTVVINYAQSFTSGPMYIMKESGYLEKNLPKDVEIKWTGLTSGTEMRDAITSGACDIADFAMGTFIVGIENNLPLKLISYASPASVNVYTNINSAKTLSDLKDNSKITVNAFASILHLAFLAQSKKELGDYMKFQNNLVPTPNLEAVAVLSNKSVDAAICSFPTSLKAEALDNVHMIADMHDVIKEYNIGSGYITSDKFYKENPDIIEGFLNAQKDVLDLYKNDFDKYAKMLADHYNIDEKVMKQELRACPPTNIISGYDKQAQMLYEAGILIKEPIKFKDLPNYNDLNE